MQVRQKPDGNFAELRDKFARHAIEKGWAQQGQQFTLEFDGDTLDVLGQTPADHDMEDGDTIDVMIA